MLILRLWLLLLVGNVAYGQDSALNNREKQRVRKFNRLCSYVKRKDFRDISYRKLFNQYVAHYSFPEDTSQTIDPRRKEMFTKLLEGLDNTVNTLDLTTYDAIPWNKFAYRGHLPKMLWEAQPITHLFGKRLPVKDDNWDKRQEEGKKELDNILVVYKIDNPEIPRYYVLFNEEDKIVCWFLLNQGGLHYFLPF